MIDTKAPERIWAWPWEIDTSRGQWALNPSVGFDGEAEYVRLDLLTAAEAERDRLVERVRVITERSDEVERANAQLARIVMAAEGCANWCDALIEMIEATSCAPDDEEAFEEVLLGAKQFLAAYRKAVEGGE